MKNFFFRYLFPILSKKHQDFVIAKYQGPISKRLIKGASYSLTGSVSTKILTLVSSIIVARLLGSKHFGELGMVLSTTNMFTVLAGFGLGVTSTKFVAEYRSIDPNKAGQVISTTNFFASVFGGICSVLFFLVAPSISETSIHAPYLTQHIRISAIILFFSAINGAQVGALSGLEDFKSIARINIISALLLLILQIILTFLFGLIGALIAIGINSLVTYFLFFFGIRQTADKFGIKIKLTWSVTNISYLWKFSLPAFLGVIVVSVTTWYINTTLVRQDNGFNEMAVISAIQPWTNFVLFIPMVISSISLPIFSNVANDKNTLIRIIKINSVASFLFGLTIALCFTLFSKIIMAFYGPTYKSYWGVLVILCFAAVLNAMNSTIGQVIASLNKMWLGFLLNSIFSIVFLFFGMVFIVIYKYGATGFAYAYLLAYTIHSICVSIASMIFIKKINTVNN